jgi:hypothetical protein
MDAIAGNSGAPVDVLFRLLALEAEDCWFRLARRKLPVEVIDAILVNPHRDLRRHFAENPRVPAEQRARLVDDPDPRVRGALAHGPDWRPRNAPPLPEDIQRRLLTDPSSNVRALARWSPLLAPHLWEEFVAPTEPGPEIFDEAAVEQALASDDERERESLAWKVSVTKDRIKALATDPAHRVRLAYASRHDLSETERAQIDYTVGPTDRVEIAAWLKESEDPDIIMAGARSANLLLRRTVTYNRRLPPEGVELLSRDTDYIVRLLLCENHSGIDPEIVLQTYIACEFVTAGDLLEHRDFPQRGLAQRFADDPNPRCRHLVTLDRDAAPDILLRLLDDPDDWVRSCVIRHPNLPADVLLACHADPVNRVAALGNPGLPAVLLHEALDEAGVPRLDT